MSAALTLLLMAAWLSTAEAALSFNTNLEDYVNSGSGDILDQYVESGCGSEIIFRDLIDLVINNDGTDAIKYIYLFDGTIESTNLTAEI